MSPLKYLPLLLLFAGPSAQAAPTFFSTVGAACIPDDVALANNSYLTTAGTVKHASGKTGLITLNCPIPIAMYAPSYIGLTFSDSNSVGPTYVQASLIGVAKITGYVGFVAATVSSEGSVCLATPPLTGYATNCQDGAVHFATAPIPAGNYDPATYTYYLQVQLGRNLTSDTSVLYSAGLYNQ